MIRCPKCGTMNRDEHRLCKQCGTTLPQTRIWCPQCGTSNPVGNILCDNCNARLVTAGESLPSVPDTTSGVSAGVKGISLPTVPIAEDGTLEPAELPDWLAELTEETAAQPAASVTADDLTPAELPDWLSELTSDGGAVVEAVEPEPAPEAAMDAGLPDWLTDFDGFASEDAAETAPEAGIPDLVSPVSAAEPVASTELPDWFSEVVETQPQPDATSPAVEPAVELPDWMAGLMEGEATASPEPEIPATASAPEWTVDLMGEGIEARDEALSPAPPELPEWLSGSEASADEVAPADTGNWFADITPTEGSPEPVPDLPDWLRADAVESSGSQEGTPRELPAWLGRAADETLEPEAVSERVMPDWLSVEYGVSPIPDQQPGDVQSPELPAQADVPEWLSGLDIAEPDTSTPDSEPTEESLPGWITAAGIEAEPESEAPPAEDVLPDWLASTSETPAPEQSSEAESVPDWLAGLGTLDEQAETASPSEPEPATGEETLPDWLTGLGPLDTEEESAPVSDAPELDAVPDWLSGAFADEEEAEPDSEIETGAEEEALPDWLSGVAPSEPESPGVEGEPASEETPDWLARAFVEETLPLPAKTETSPEEEETLPDWLSGVVTTGAEPETPESAPFQTADETEVESRKLLETAPAFEGGASADVTPGAVPEWLSGLDEAGEGESATFTEAEPEMAASGEGIATADLPAWLRDVPAEVDDLAPKPAAPAFVSEDIAGDEDLADEGAAFEGASLEEAEVPDWLQALGPVSEVQSSLEADVVGEENNLTRAEVPTWMQQLRPPGTGPLPALPETAHEIPDALSEDTSGLALADIPKWVQQLKPPPEAEEGAAVTGDVIVEPVEMEGPVAGLPGVLPAGLAVDMPSDYRVPPQPEMPADILAQAQLWQELLERPPSVERPVAQQRARTGAGTTTVRLVVSLILVAVTVFGLWMGGPRWSQALGKARVEALLKAIDALQPGARVIVAVEYGPAESGEMAPIAETLLSHLAEKQVEVIGVSTLPEGAGLARGLFELPSMVDQPQDGRSLYLAGSSSAVALFMNEGMEDVDLLLVLSARVDRLRWWVELNSATNLAGAPFPMGVGASASIGPQILPYLDSPQVAGGLVGFADVVAYRESRGLTSDFFNSKLDALMFAHWAAVCLMLLGFIYSLAVGKKGSV